MADNYEGRPADFWRERSQEEIRLKAMPIRKVLDELDELRRQQESDALWSQMRDEGWIQDSLETYDRIQRSRRLEELRQEINFLSENEAEMESDT